MSSPQRKRPCVAGDQPQEVVRNTLYDGPSVVRVDGADLFYQRVGMSLGDYLVLKDGGRAASLRAPDPASHPKQDIAYVALEEHNFTGIMMSQDIRPNDASKKFYVATFLQYMKLMNRTEPQRRWTYELCHSKERDRGVSAVHLHADIEIYYSQNGGKVGSLEDYDRVTRPIFLREIADYLVSFLGLPGGKEDIKVVELDSSNDKKLSRHYIWHLRGAMFSINTDCGAFMRNFENAMIKKHGDPAVTSSHPFYFYCEKPKNTPPCLWVDRRFICDAVYTVNRNFRMEANTKSNCFRPLIRMVKSRESGPREKWVPDVYPDVLDLTRVLESAIMGIIPFSIDAESGMVRLIRVNEPSGAPSHSTSHHSRHRVGCHPPGSLQFGKGGVDRTQDISLMINRVMDAIPAVEYRQGAEQSGANISDMTHGESEKNNDLDLAQAVADLANTGPKDPSRRGNVRWVGSRFAAYRTDIYGNTKGGDALKLRIIPMGGTSKPSFVMSLGKELLDAVSESVQEWLRSEIVIALSSQKHIAIKYIPSIYPRYYDFFAYPDPTLILYTEARSSAQTTGAIAQKYCPILKRETWNGPRPECTHANNHQTAEVNLRTKTMRWSCFSSRCSGKHVEMPIPESIVKKFGSAVQKFIDNMDEEDSIDVMGIMRMASAVTIS